MSARIGGVIREIAQGLAARRGLSTILLVLSLTFLLVVSVTLSRADEERTALGQILDEGVSRVIEIRAVGQGASIPPMLVSAALSISGTTYGIGAGPAADATLSPSLRGPVGLRHVVVSGAGLRLPDCLAPVRRAALDQRTAEEMGVRTGISGVVLANGSEFTVARIVVIPNEVSELISGALTTCPLGEAEPPDMIISVLVVAESIDRVSTLAKELEAFIAPLAPDVAVESAADLAEFRRDIGGGVNGLRRLTAYVAVMSLPVLYLIVGTALAVNRRSEFGRRRALGCGRGLLIVLVLGESTGIATAASFIAVITVAALQAASAPWADVSWLIPAVVVMYVSSVLGQVPVVLSAALTDPVAVLRVP